MRKQLFVVLLLSLNIPLTMASEDELETALLEDQRLVALIETVQTNARNNKLAAEGLMKLNDQLEETNRLLDKLLDQVSSDEFGRNPTLYKHIEDLNHKTPDRTGYP